MRTGRLAALGGALLACALAGCAGARPAAEPPRSTGRCSTFAPPRELGRVGSPALNEISGVVASRAHPGVLWVHDDSGTGAVLFAIDLSGRLLGEYTYEGAPAYDWEDIAIEVVPGGPDRLWIGDVGDNDARGRGRTGRQSVEIVRVDEPEIDASRDAPHVETRTTFDVITLRYPDRAHDCEAIAIDPATGDLLVLAKENGDPSDVLRARAPIADRAEVVLERVATIDTGNMVTAADVSPDGLELLVRTYRSVLAWERAADEAWSAALARAPRTLPAPPEPQGESIALTADGSGYLTISEGADVPIYLFERRCE